jgi:LemA protein
MSKKLWIGPAAAIGLVVVSIIAFGACQYNSLVNAREDAQSAWGQVQIVLQRRAELIPNLVETVKGFASHESEVFASVNEARTRLLNAQGNPKEAAAANEGMNSALGRLLAISENYPQLRSNENFIRLQDELAGTENRIAVERKRYNDAVTTYNKMILTLPKSLFAGIFGFEKKEYFEADADKKAAPTVKF